jgi:hypothetical protein
MKNELVREVGRFIFFLLAVAGWTYTMLLLGLEYGG